MFVLNVLFYVFSAVALIQLLYYFIFLKNFALLKPDASKPTQLAVSVIIYAKNQAKNLKKHLPKILNQKYPNFEVILVNDASTDKTLKVMESFKQQHDIIRIVDVKMIEHFWGNKKYALTLGIKASKHDTLLFIDADCAPISKHWISEMSSQFSATKSIVLGFGGYEKIKKSLLNKIIRFETLFTAIQYFTYAKIGIPYMGVSRNLAYNKKVFFDNSGFMSHMNLKSGDDDLFINQAATKSNTAICFSEDSFTISKPTKTFKTWILQKRRDINTTKNYKTKHRFLLGLFYTSQLLLWFLAILLLSFLFNWQIVIGILVIRSILHYITIAKSAKKLDQADLIILIPFLEIFLIIFQLVIFSANLMSKQNHWK
jgi:glycosyltransferase involved in cell wall biosynthesis